LNENLTNEIDRLKKEHIDINNEFDKYKKENEIQILKKDENFEAINQTLAN